jgi:hypothetical protein
MNSMQQGIRGKRVFKFPVLFTVILMFLVGSLLVADPTPSKAIIGTGKIIESVACLHDLSETYSLYLPSNYTVNRKWPVLFAFDYEARTTLPLSLFEEAAERYGYILICSYNTRNGRKAPILKAMLAIWQDATTRFSIDKERIYTTGLSGGSRMASVFHMVVDNPVRGIIAVGAGIAPHIKPRDIQKIHFFGICGYADFNYKEMLTLEKKLAKQDTPNRFIYYQNKHQWPPQTICTRALEWFEMMAISKGLIAKEGRESIINEIYTKELALASLREKKGELFYAAKDYHAIARTFTGLVNIETPHNKAVQLSELHAYTLFQREDLVRIKRERNYYRKFSGVFNAIKNSPPNAIKSSKLLKFAGLNELLAIIKKNRNPYERSLAERTLYTLISNSRIIALDYMKKGDYQRANIAWELARTTRKHVFFYPEFYIHRACTYARLGKKKKAIKTLHIAVNHGYKNLDFIMHSKDFATIRSSIAFKKLTLLLTESHNKP